MGKRGIYVITNTVTNEQYVGASHDIERRWHDHLLLLRRGVHRNKRLQSAWTEHGEDAFTFRIIERVKDAADLWDREREHIRALGLWKYNKDRDRKPPRRRRGRSEEPRTPMIHVRFRVPRETRDKLRQIARWRYHRDVNITGIVLDQLIREEYDRQQRTAATRKE